jgi:hypothetical protein
VSQEVTGTKCVPTQDAQQGKSGKQNLTHQMWWVRFWPKNRESSGRLKGAQKYFHRKFHHNVTLGFGSFGDK